MWHNECITELFKVSIVIEPLVGVLTYNAPSRAWEREEREKAKGGLVENNKRVNKLYGGKYRVLPRSKMGRKTWNSFIALRMIKEEWNILRTIFELMEEL